MTLELSIVISVLSVSFALYSGISNLKRNDKKDTAEETAQLTTVIVKLENIGDGVSEIKSDMKNVKGEVQELRNALWPWSSPPNPPTTALMGLRVVLMREPPNIPKAKD